ncbi:fungal-specific transcription factor domain-containing protein [Plectosphaerella plurivora]|uniref:Fungal-specific transcription factor domain-containing protein n=1 Tax=Plectosphaerella plurivora TaxID=936078 RepID=A0A9P8VJB0_9PEZI|nr:fungal-specific transcription factor domain-containing protein [Plectosphaerella plurivora]
MDDMDDQYSEPSSMLPDYGAVAGTRRYRSKAQRPCDLCRARKVLCNIPDPSQPCQLCTRIGRNCTFVGNPGKRRAAAQGNSPSSTGAQAHGQGRATAMEVTVSPPGVLMSQDGPDHHQLGISDMSGPGMQTTEMEDMNLLDAPSAIWPSDNDINWDLSNDPFAHTNLQNQVSPSAFQIDFLPDLAPRESQTPSDVQRDVEERDSALAAQPSSKATPGSSMDLRADHSTTFIGYSNESDPFALNHFPHDSRDEIEFFRVTYRKFNPDSTSSAVTRPLHFLQSQTGTVVEARRIVDDYFRFVFPALPILSRSLVLRDVSKFVTEAPTGLLAGVYALSLPFAPWDETLCLSNAYAKPSVDALWKISYTSLQREMHFPHLSCIQIYLLLQNHFQFDSVSVETPFVWSTAASMLAMAQSLGLHTDPSGWSLPAWEIRLRRRLWWAVYCEHTWRSITHGRSSMIRHDDWDVSPPCAEDFAAEEVLRLPDDIEKQSPDYFIHLCALTAIADGICRQFFTLRAVSRQQTLDTLITQARSHRQQLLDWLENLPDTLQLNVEKDDFSAEDTVESHAPLYVVYYTAHILLFRALLRPIIARDPEPNAPQGSTAAILQASRSLIQTVVKFVCGLDARHQSAFWPAYTRHCLSYPGLFCFMLSTQRAEPHMAAFDRRLLDTWRRTLRTRVQSWPLLRFAIVKVDAIYWKGLQRPVSQGEK